MAARVDGGADDKRMDVKEAKRRGFMKIGEVAKRLDTTSRTLLYYEEEGILSPLKTARGTRMYSESDVKRLAMAQRIAALGIPLKTIRELATTREMSATGDESGRRLCGLLDEMDTVIDERIASLSAMQRDLVKARVILRQCWDCPNTPSRETCPHCPCEAYREEADLLYLTWDGHRT